MRLSSMLLFLAGCNAGPSGAGDYWCVTGSPNERPVGSCSAHKASCESRLRLDSAKGRGLTCKKRHTLAYELRWKGKYGAMEAWFVDEATCERERKARKIGAECKASAWDGRGKKAH